MVLCGYPIRQCRMPLIFLALGFLCSKHVSCNDNGKVAPLTRSQDVRVHLIEPNRLDEMVQLIEPNRPSMRNYNNNGMDGTIPKVTIGTFYLCIIYIYIKRPIFIMCLWLFNNLCRGFIGPWNLLHLEPLERTSLKTGNWEGFLQVSDPFQTFLLLIKNQNKQQSGKQILTPK